ncbi:MAG TPA: hypothetical protein VIK87_08350 [Sphingomonadales bacterium]
MTHEQEVLTLLEDGARRMMAALSWTPERAPDWDSFRALFHKDAKLVPAARPAAPITVETFIDRMQTQRDNGSLVDFQEDHIALAGHVFGNVATVFQTYRTIINKGEPGYGISAMVWIFDENAWRCISMAWDAQTAEKQIPAHYMGA